MAITSSIEITEEVEIRIAMDDALRVYKMPKDEALVLRDAINRAFPVEAS